MFYSNIHHCEYAIVGAGIAGLTAGIALQSLQKDFLIFEQSQKLNAVGAGMGLAANGMYALDLLDMKDKAEKIGFYVDQYQLLNQYGKVILNPNTKQLSQIYQQKNFTVHRGDLQEILKNELPDERLFLHRKVISFRQDAEGVEMTIENLKTQKKELVRCKYLIGADGVKSFIRQQLLPISIPRYAGYTCWRAIIDNSEVQLKEGSETWGSAGRFGLTPLSKRRLYWYACVNAKVDDATFKSFQIEDLQKRFSDYHRNIRLALQHTDNQNLILHDIYDIKPISQFAFRRIVLIGDAAHATTPNMGQGACMGLEDVAVLKDEIQKNKNVTVAFVAFQQRRLKRTRYIIEKSKWIGEVAQWENKWLINIRNGVAQMMPSQLTQSPISNLLNVDFMK